MADYTADQLKIMALHYLRRAYPGALLVTEQAAGAWARGSIDAAAIISVDCVSGCGPAIAAVECKGQGDAATRLPEQKALYGRVADYLWCAATPSLVNQALTKWQHKPSFLEVDEHAGRLMSRSRRGDGADPGLSEPGVPSAHALASLLWAREASEVVDNCLPRLPEAPRIKRSECLKDELASWLGEHVPVAIVRDAVVRTLWSRIYERPGERYLPGQRPGGQAYAKRGYFPDDPLPTLEASEVPV